MFENVKLARNERITKKSIKEQFEKILVTYPIARKQRPYELEEKHAKLVLMAQATSMTSPYSYDYCILTMYGIMGYSTNKIPTFEEACKILGVTANSFYVVGGLENLYRNNAVVRNLPELLVNWNMVA